MTTKNRSKEAIASDINTLVLYGYTRETNVPPKEVIGDKIMYHKGESIAFVMTTAEEYVDWLDAPYYNEFDFDNAGYLKENNNELPF